VDTKELTSHNGANNLYDLTPFYITQSYETAPTPLSKEVQQTYFELQKKSMPELDVFTQE
jgi:hypothetical protein